MNCRHLFSTRVSPSFSIPKKLHYWLTDTIKTRYSTLDKLLECLISCAARAIAKRKERKGPNGSSSTLQEPTTTPSSNIPLEEDRPKGYVATQAARLALLDRYSIYAGNAAGDMNQVLLFGGTEVSTSTTLRCSWEQADLIKSEMVSGIGRWRRKRQNFTDSGVR